MAGVKQFDRNQLLSQAMMVFWRYGYQATSIQDLVEATGVNRGSLYATFGDKCGLFLAVLDYYAGQIAHPIMAELNNPSPRQAIEAMFEAIIRRTSDPKWPRGCLNTNTSLECPGAGDKHRTQNSRRVGPAGVSDLPCFAASTGRRIARPG